MAQDDQELSIIFRSFHVRTIGEMLKKLEWEISRLKVDMLSELPYSATALRASSYGAINAAITAFHISDWIWAISSDKQKALWIKDVPGGKDKKAQKLRFQIMLKNECPAFQICRGIANSAKHLVDDKYPEPVRNGKTQNLPVPARAGALRAGEPLMKYSVELTTILGGSDGDGGVPHRAIDVFTKAYEFFDSFCLEHGLLEDIVLDTPH